MHCSHQWLGLGIYHNRPFYNTVSPCENRGQRCRLIGSSPSAPFCRHTLSLYAHVSKIIWNFEQRDRIAGVIDDPSHSNMDTFDLGEEATCESVNTLWDIIGGGGKKS
jgi:hypothetical protein